MIEDFGTPVAEASFELESGLVRICRMDGEEESRYIGKPLEDILQSPLFERMDGRSRLKAEVSLASARPSHGPGAASVDASLVLRLVNPDAINRKLLLTMRQLGTGRRGVGILTVADVTAQLLTEDVLSHLSMSELMLVGVVDAASETAVVCRPGELRGSLVRGDTTRYEDRISEILSDATDEERRDLLRKASMKEVRARIGDGGSYSLVFACGGVDVALGYRQIRWSYLDREDETMVLTVSDVSELYSELRDAQYRAEHDELTGALNRRGGEERALEAYRRFLNGAACSVAMFDVDNFKSFNDNHSHETGNRVLREIAKNMTGVNGGRCEVWRYGGDEFVVLVPGVGKEGAGRLADEMREAAERSRVASDGETLGVTISGGIDWFDLKHSDDHGAVRDAVDRADTKLRAAKGFGRNQIVYQGSGWDDKLASGLERLARAIFEDYKRTLEKQGKPVEYERYEDQPEDFRNSDRAQAADLWRKVESVGCEVVPLDKVSGRGEVLEFSPEQIEAIARLEHERWTAERKAAGWRYAEEKDEEGKLSPWMIPYDELPEDMKEYDRDSARNIISLLRSAGLAVVDGDD